MNAKELLGKQVTVTIDRPLGSRHPKHKSILYYVNYGYVKGLIAADNEEQDAYILGVDEPVEVFTGKVWAVIHRNNDVEDKLVVCPDNYHPTKETISEQVRFQEQYFDYEIILSEEAEDKNNLNL